MTEWYYAKGGQQNGPVSFEKLRDLAASGMLDPGKDLVWNATMKDWVPAGQVEGIFVSKPNPIAVPPADPSNPYSAPQSAWIAPTSAPGTGLSEIIPGSDPIDPVLCLKHAFELTKRQFGNILLVGLVYFGILIGLSLVIGFIQGLTTGFSPSGVGGTTEPSVASVAALVVAQIINQVVSMFLGLGLTKIALNLVSGKDVSVGMLFGEGGKLLRAMGAAILFGLMVGIGFLFLVFPGVYLALRYGQFLNAIVDKNLGVFESFKYSASITTNNKLNIFLVWVLGFLVTIAGMLACFVGLIFAGPVVWLTFTVAYRWMQFGRIAASDKPGTTIPALAGS